MACHHPPKVARGQYAHPRAGTAEGEVSSETRRWLLTGERVVRDVICCSNFCWNYWGFARKVELGAGFYEPSSGLVPRSIRAQWINKGKKGDGAKGGKIPLYARA